ncbi:MAG: D-inositol-3-phosphate glycosyltransferase [Mycobacterium sp.]|nr:D-inositol-3-phosphate glycosyltransferase [Mycobacterium sp.]
MSRTAGTRVLVVDQAVGLWGAQRYLLRLAPLLRALDVELTLCCPPELELFDAWREIGFAAEPASIPTQRNIRVNGSPSAGKLMSEGVGALRVARSIAAMARDRFDVLWANAHWIHLDVAIASKLAGTPAVLHLHEEALPGLGVWLRSRAIQMSAHGVAVSRRVSEGLPPRIRKRVSVIPNGVDTNEFSPVRDRNSTAAEAIRREFGFGHDDIMVLAATRLDPVKRIEDLTAAIVAIGDPRIRLVIAGTTSNHVDYQRRVIDDAKHRAGAAVKFCGRRDDIVNLLRASDVFVHAGVVEGMPLGLIEAQACGVPVVAYDAAGVSEAVRDGTTGLIAPAGDVQSLTDALKRLALDSSLRAGFRSAARENALANHRIEIQAERNAQLLRAVAGRTPIPG